MRPTCCLIALSLWSAGAVAQAVQLAPPKDRISDEVIQADHRTYEALQARIKALNDGGRPVRDYHLAKAQCWLDVSFHEYTRNDRGPFPQEALTESEKLLAAMERGQVPLPRETALVGESVRLRPDLWERVDALKSHSGFRCAQHKVACAEVELVHAGNEHNQQQWRHARPYVQIAEDLLGEARLLADQCEPPPAPRVAAMPVPLPPPAPPAPAQEVLFTTSVVFSFDRYETGDIRPFSVVQLEALVQRLQRENLVVQSIRLTGHADRLNGTGRLDYNQRLSERRVQTVREMLVRLGVDNQLVAADARGDADPVQACEARFASQADLHECLLPNRRVDVLISARRR
jgi:outer membrane protein OmpA-like peptidoglycan-associated protein